MSSISTLAFILTPQIFMQHGAAQLKRRADLQERRRESYSMPDSRKLSAACRIADSKIRKNLRRHLPPHQRPLAPRTSMSTYTGDHKPTSPCLDGETASSPPKMDHMMDSLEVFSLSTKDENDESSSLVSGRTQLRADHPRKSPLATSDSERTTMTLLALPFEIRSAILRQVMGDRHVHTRFNQDDHSDFESTTHRPRLTFCCDGFLEDLDLFIKDDGFEPLFPERRNSEGQTYRQRHSYCIEGGVPNSNSFIKFKTLRNVHELLRKYNPALTPFDEVHASFDPDAFDARLSVLTVCRQLRAEGYRALYSFNVFSFVDSYSFNVFTKYLTVEKASLIRKIQLSLMFECDEIENSDVFEKDGPPNIRSNWTVGGAGPRYENMWAALDGLTDVTIWVCDKVPIAYRPRSERKATRETRLKRIGLWLRWVFGDLRDLRKIRKAKVLVSWISEYEGLATREQIQYEADKEELQGIGDDFAREILSTMLDRHIA